MKKINWTTVGALSGVILVIAALSAWGDLLHMNVGALNWVRTLAAMIGAAVIALFPSLIRDEDGDGIPDIIETKITTTAVVTETKTETK